MLGRQEESQKEGHSKIMSDIDSVRGNIQEVWDRLGQSYLSPAAAVWITCIVYR